MKKDLKMSHVPMFITYLLNIFEVGLHAVYHVPGAGH